MISPKRYTKILIMKNYLKQIAFCTLLIGLIIATSAKATGITYTIDLSKRMALPTYGYLKLGSNATPTGDSLNANSLFFIKNGKPWFPVMGEIHYVRLPEREWEEAILKMKASGIDIIATYVFWNYHEEQQGIFNWTGDRNLRAFAQLCRKHNMYLFLRIGPWCHGEVRYGGFPDWVQQLQGGTRKDNPIYLKYVESFFKEIGKQVQGLLFKDNGPIIGTQIENEYRFNNEKGYAHIMNLKKLAVEAGIDTPYYTATGWPGSNTKQNELIPVWGGYPEAPWSKSTAQLPLSENYLFGPLRNDPLIGNDLLGKQEDTSMEGYRYPYATAEMGGGNQITYHRRPIITSDDVVAQAYTKTGSGANLLGYYMYHGGSNKIGKYSTLQESKATTYPNDYPVLSYDFYSPLGEWGQVRESLKDFKVLHYFLNDFGARLATMHSHFSEQNCSTPGCKDSLRMAVRSSGESGFVFVSNYQRQLEMKDLKDVRFQLKTNEGDTLCFPSKGLTVTKNTQMILPFRMDLNGALLKYATMQPLCVLNNPVPTYVFFSHAPNESELALKAEHIKRLSIGEEIRSPKEGEFILRFSSSESKMIHILMDNGKETNILLITHQEARNSWKIYNGQLEYLCISPDEVIPDSGKLTIRKTGNSVFNISIYPADGLQLHNTEKQAVLKNQQTAWSSDYQVSLPPVDIQLIIKGMKDPNKHRSDCELLPEDNRLDSVPLTCPGPQYFVNFKPVEGSSYWQIRLPKQTNKSYVSNTFLQLDYTGDTGSLYQEGKLIADDYFAGLPMTYSLNRLNQKKGDLLFQIVPFRKDLKIYFEKGIREKLQDNEAILQHAQVIPQYEITFLFNH
nr:beta-galactosidase [uncultured Bacteroides sp.]